MNERITSLDEVEEQASVAVTFKVNSAVLSAEAKSQLDEFAEKALAAAKTMQQAPPDTVVKELETSLAEWRKK